MRPRWLTIACVLVLFGLVAPPVHREWAETIPPLTVAMEPRDTIAVEAAGRVTAAQRWHDETRANQLRDAAARQERERSAVRARVSRSRSVGGRVCDDGCLARLRACEAGGDYGAVSSSGKYRGAYQADRATWNGYGGYSDPAAAPPAVQDQFARDLYARRGPQPWPTCG